MLSIPEIWSGDPEKEINNFLGADKNADKLADWIDTQFRFEIEFFTQSLLSFFSFERAPVPVQLVNGETVDVKVVLHHMAYICVFSYGLHLCFLVSSCNAARTRRRDAHQSLAVIPHTEGLALPPLFPASRAQFRVVVLCPRPAPCANGLIFAEAPHQRMAPRRPKFGKDLGKLAKIWPNRPQSANTFLQNLTKSGNMSVNLATFLKKHFPKLTKSAHIFRKSGDIL